MRSPRSICRWRNQVASSARPRKPLFKFRYRLKRMRYLRRHMASLDRNGITAAHTSSGLINGQDPQDPTQLSDCFISTLTTIEECVIWIRALHTCVHTRYGPYITTLSEAAVLAKLR